MTSTRTSTIRSRDGGRRLHKRVWAQLFTAITSIVRNLVSEAWNALDLRTLSLLRRSGLPMRRRHDKT